MRKTPTLEIEEISGDKKADLKTAQDAALSSFSVSIHAVIRDLLERGVLVVDNGKKIPTPEEKNK